jgi:DnaJ-class molecular chaperone
MVTAQAEIKKAWKKQATQFHPDKNPGDASAQASFIRASDAYSTLSDPEKKQEWDRYGGRCVAVSEQACKGLRTFACAAVENGIDWLHDPCAPPPIWTHVSPHTSTCAV